MTFTPLDFLDKFDYPYYTLHLKSFSFLLAMYKTSLPEISNLFQTLITKNWISSKKLINSWILWLVTCVTSIEYLFNFSIRLEADMLLLSICLKEELKFCA